MIILMKRSLLVFAVALFGLVASAAPVKVFEDGSFLFGIIDDEGGKVSLLGYADKTLPENLVIPSAATFSGTTYEVTELGYRAFSDNSVSTTESFDKTWSQSPATFKTVEIPNTVISIDQGAFNSCKALESVTFGNSVEVIGQGAFRYCDALKDAVLPNSVTTIDQGAFNDCTGLESVTFGTGLKTIDQRVFLGCSALTEIIVLPTTPPATAKNSFNGVPTDGVVYVPAQSGAAYKAAVGWDKFTDIREMGTLTVSLSESTLELTVGEKASLSVDVTKEGDVEQGAEVWESTNVGVVTVDSNGELTAVAEGSAKVSCTVTDNFGRTYTVVCDVTVSVVNGLHAVLDQPTDSPAEYFNLLGKKVDPEALAPGIYIRKQNNTTHKVVIR